MKVKYLQLAMFFIPFMYPQCSVAKDFGLQIGYANIGVNYGFVGLEARITEKNCLNIGVGSYATLRNNQLEILPEAHINLRPFNENKILFNLLMTEVSLTNKFINPSIGLNFLNHIKIKTGYCLPYQKSNFFKGITFGIILTISGFKNNYGDNLKIIQ